MILKKIAQSLLILTIMMLSTKSYSQEKSTSIEGIYYFNNCDLSNKKSFKSIYGNCLTVQFLKGNSGVIIEHPGNKTPFSFKYEIRENDIYIDFKNEGGLQKVFTLSKELKLYCVHRGFVGSQTNIEWKRLKFQ